ncbi:MAG TPA: zf-HC2 domain-containing protein [Acidimicrobiales bacterium]
MSNAPPPDAVTCASLVTEITDLLEGAIAPDERTRVDAHLEVCPGCRAALAQFEVTIAAVGRLGLDDVQALDPEVLDQLTEIFVTRAD